MFPVNFKKTKALHFLDCLANGGEIGEVRTADDMVQLAGACFFALQSHGPMIKQAVAEMKGEEYEPPETTEYREAEDETILADLHGAIEFVGHLSMLVQDGEYDEKCEPVLRCVLFGRDHKVHPVEGFKQTE